MESLKENDGWNGPEVKPEDEQFIKLFWGKDLSFNVGYFSADYGFEIDAVEMPGYHPIDWKDVACWKPIEIETIPDRFKKQD